MNLLVTAGNTQTLIDKVRCITNIFTGRTGAALALEAYRRGHTVTLLTSHPEAVADMLEAPPIFSDDRWSMKSYRTFDDLHKLMAELVPGKLDGVIHSAAVNDYESAGIFAPAAGTSFDPTTRAWSGSQPRLVDRAAGKVKSDEPELWLRLVRAPKLIDMIRRDWKYRGVLVKFKLEVGVSEEELLKITESSRLHSSADLMVANTLEGSASWALVGPVAGQYQRVNRRQLAENVLIAVESLHEEGRRKEARHG
ncbi:MAG: bifunctional phosphopantothenoylcysteine decarboxylase/phosphopantothenate synthase [Planctomycetes bacterium]|nr:bifunctional phosphopantothenoylcysteine decarboxylase/phosphopantothenate synthase [Planctomycetota bacterium]